MPVNPFLTELIARLLTGFAACLKDVDPQSPLHFEYRDGKSRLYLGRDQLEAPLNSFLEALLSDLLETLTKRLHHVDPDQTIWIRLD